MPQVDNLPEPPDPPDPPEGSFGANKRRFAVELGVIASIVVLGGIVLLWSSSRLAGFALGRVPISVDNALGNAAWKQMQLNAKECTNPEATAYVSELVSPLLANLPEQQFEWHFAVMNDNSVNAFALPGGYVFVNFGLIAKAESGEEIIGVLAHELSHVLLRHGVSNVLRNVGTRLLLGLIFGVSDVTALLQYSAKLTELSYQRDQETEADIMGQKILKRAGISPRGMAQFFTRLSALGVNIPAFLSTHPDSDKRAERALASAAGFSATVVLPSPESIRCE